MDKIDNTRKGPKDWGFLSGFITPSLVAGF
jgi:hypothetical protein